MDTALEIEVKVHPDNTASLVVRATEREVEEVTEERDHTTRRRSTGGGTTRRIIQLHYYYHRHTLHLSVALL